MSTIWSVELLLKVCSSMVRVLPFLTVTLFCVPTSFSQGYDDNWCFGATTSGIPGNGLDFTNTTGGYPTVLTNSGMDATEGSACISDQNGNLLFYTDGFEAFDNSHNIMPNGFGLGGDWSTLYPAMIVPDPGNFNQYYILSNDGAPTSNGTGLHYSIVDMCLNNGLGDVVSGQKAINLMPATTEFMHGCYHGNGTDYWVVVLNWIDITGGTTKLYAYHVSASGISAPVITDLALFGYGDNDVMDFQFSPTNQQAVISLMTANFTPTGMFNNTLLLDFDNLTGVFSFSSIVDSRDVSNNIGNWSANGGFSPDGTKWYCVSYITVGLINSKIINQYDLSNLGAGPVTVAPLIEQLYPFAAKLDLRAGPDGNLYLSAVGFDNLSAFLNPNATGLGSNFQASIITFPTVIWSSTMPNRILYPLTTQLNAPNVDFSYIDTCINSGVSYTYTGDPGFDSLVWNFGDGTSTNQLDPAHLYNAAGTYTVSVTFYGTCTIAQMSYDITIIDEIDINLGNDITLCFGDSITLDAGNAGATYQWNTGNTTMSINVQDAGIYSVSAEQNGCTGSDTVEVTMITSLDAGNDNDSTLCFQNSIIDLNDMLSIGVNQGFWEEISPPSGEFSTITGELNLTGIAGTYNFMYVASNTSNCLNDTAYFDITVLPELIPGFQIIDQEPCVPASFTLECTNDFSTLQSVDWIVNGELFFNQNTITVDSLSPGSYNVEISITTNDGCQVTTSFIDTLVVPLSPIAEFNYSPGTIYAEMEIQLINLSMNADSYYWSIENGTPPLSTATNPTFSVSQGGADESFEIMLVAISDLGCVDTTIMVLLVQPEILVFVPNAFTPNGDMFNNIWKIEISGIDNYDFELTVHNRWGEMIWEAHDPNIGWDGTYNGVLIQQGTYNWMLIVNDRNNANKLKFSGHVNVLK